MREFNVGDKVKCIDAGSINRELKNGETYIVSHVDTNGFVKLKGLSSYYYDPSRFKKIEYTYEDLKKSPIGTKIIFENKNYLIKENSSYEEDCFFNYSCSRSIKNLKGLKDSAPYGTLGKIIKIEEPTYRTVYEAKPEILDEAEKRYLKQVIRPFKNKVKCIKKFVFPTGSAIIQIGIERDNSTWHISLPPFATNDMYKGMKDDKEYTLEDLGL